jgi:hypothetical protein
MLSKKPKTAISALLGALFLGILAIHPQPVFASSFFNDACPGDVCNTAIGPIDISSDFSAIKDILGLVVGIGGAIAFLLMIYGVYILTTSAGIPDKVNQGKEIISSAIFGLVFIIMSLIVFRIIGINILAIPGIS